MAKIGNKSNAPYKLLPRSTPCEVHFSGVILRNHIPHSCFLYLEKNQ